MASAPLSPRCSLGRARKMAEDIVRKNSASSHQRRRQRNRSVGRGSLCRGRSGRSLLSISMSMRTPKKRKGESGPSLPNHGRGCGEILRDDWRTETPSRVQSFEAELEFSESKQRLAQESSQYEEAEKD